MSSSSSSMSEDSSSEENDAPPTRGRESNFTTTFDVLVGSGPTETRFTVHQDIITKRSGFFRAARSERWTADKSKPADLHEHDPKIFNKYLHCLYHNAVPRAPPLPELMPYPPPEKLHDPDTIQQWNKQKDVRNAAIHAQHMELVRLYILADSLTDPTTANLAIDAIRRFSTSSGKNPSAKVINFTFSSTRDDDGLRMLFADSYVYDDIELPRGDLPKEFLRMVVETFLASVKEDDIVVSDVQYKFFKIVKNRDDIDGWEWHKYYQKVEEDKG